MERYSRQRDIIPAEDIAKCFATVIGVGAIGRQVALQLTAIGIPKLQLIDFDTVEESNIASQGYREKDLGSLKVEATGEHCKEINSSLELNLIPERFKRNMDVGNCVFCCVDSIETRKFIWDSIEVPFFVDGRMSAETMEIITAKNGDKRYEETLFSAEEAYQGSCTAKTTIYCANAAAALMLSSFTKHLRVFPSDRHISFNLLTTELTVV